jgi:GNAT superfamily N-acetyltransferase
MSDSPLEIRRMTRADLNIAWEFCIEEGWNPGKFDQDAFYAADPNGFFLGLLNGVPIGSVSAVAYDARFGFIGLYIVRPAYRGLGYGLQLFRTALNYLGDRSIGLDAVTAQQANYRKAGFEFAYRNIRHRGVFEGVETPDVFPLAELPVTQLEAFDAEMFGAARPRFLRQWITLPDSVALGVLKGDAIVGYGVLRPRQEGYQIGPLYARTPQAAESLFRSLAAQRPGQTIFYDALECNPESMLLAQRHGLEPIFETARMYARGRPTIPVGCHYSVSSFELG